MKVLQARYDQQEEQRQGLQLAVTNSREAKSRSACGAYQAPPKVAKPGFSRNLKVLIDRSKFQEKYGGQKTEGNTPSRAERENEDP